MKLELCEPQLVAISWPREPHIVGDFGTPTTQPYDLFGWPQKMVFFNPTWGFHPEVILQKNIFYWSTHPKYGLKKTIHIFETPKLGNFTRWARPTNEWTRCWREKNSLGEFITWFMGNITRLDYSNEVYKATCDWGRPHLMDDIDRPNFRSLHGVLACPVKRNGGR